MNYIISASTDIGNTKQTNQDSYNVRVLSSSLGKVAFAVLCDGMGGLSKGEVASTSLVKAFMKWSETRLPTLMAAGLTDDIIRGEWADIAVSFNEKIKLYGKKIGSAVGTTVAALLLTDDRYYIANVGDTRVYEIADEISVLTKDQTVVAREVELGHLTPEQAETDERRSVLLQCVGASNTVYPDMFFGTTKKNAVYMLCSDGFRHEISSDEIWTYLHPDVMLDPDGMKRNMDYLIYLDKERRERDNITVVSIRTF